MTLFEQVSAAVLLVVLTLCLQCIGIATLVRWLRSSGERHFHQRGIYKSAVPVMQAAVGIILLQGISILLWASWYRWLCFPSWSSAFYFSATSYSTVGYGDVVLPAKWRLLGPLESMLGVLMCGISVSLMYALITRLIDGPTSHLRVAENPVAPEGPTDADTHRGALP